MNREPGPEFLLNIALKYSIIENVVSVILFKCILPVSRQGFWAEIEGVTSLIFRTTSTTAT